MGGCNLDGNTSNLARLCYARKTVVIGFLLKMVVAHIMELLLTELDLMLVYGGQSSDYRIKENIVNVSNGITLLKQLRPC